MDMNDMYGDDLELESTLENIRESLKFKDAQSLKTFILERKLSDESIFYEVAGELATNLTAENLENAPVFFEACQRCMTYIVKRGNPKEILIAILEQMDSFKDDEKFKALLEYIKEVLLKLPSKMVDSLEIVLETVHAHILELPRPADHQLEKDERKLLELDRDVRRITDVILAYLDFLQTFVSDVSLKNPEALREKSTRQIDMLMKRLLSMLDHPLMYLDLVFFPKEMEEREKTYGRLCAEKVVELLTELGPNLFRLIEDGQFCTKRKAVKHSSKGDDAEKNEEQNEQDDSLSDGDAVSYYSYACLSYLIFKEQLAMDSIPFIYTHPHILQANLKCVMLLLKADHSLVKFKGIYLLQSLMGKIPVTTLSLNDLDNENFMLVLNALIDIMIQNPVKELRQECVQLYSPFIKMFSLSGRYKIYETVMNTCPHAGVIGYTIQLLKDQVDSVLKNKEDDDDNFLGTSLLKLLKVVAVVEEGATQDILQISDRVIALLNFFRFLLLRDPPTENLTKIWDYLTVFEKQFFEPLRLALDLSKGHYHLDLQDLKDGQRKSKGDSNIDLGLTVGGVTMPRVPVSQQIQIVESALNTFDVIDSILCRISEIVDMQKSNLKTK